MQCPWQNGDTQQNRGPQLADHRASCLGQGLCHCSHEDALPALVWSILLRSVSVGWGVSWASLPSRLLIAFVLDEESFAWQGYLYAILLFLTALIQSLCLQQYFSLCFQLGINVRASLIAAIYKKVGIALSSPLLASSKLGWGYQHPLPAPSPWGDRGVCPLLPRKSLAFGTPTQRWGHWVLVLPGTWVLQPCV